MKTRALWIALVFAPVALASENFETTIPIPTAGPVDLGWSAANCMVRTVTLKNFPKPETIEKARKSDPKDTSPIWWQFRIENRGKMIRVRFLVEVYGPNGEVVKSADKTETIDGGVLDVYVRVSTSMRTLDIADSPKVHLRAEMTPF